VRKEGREGEDEKKAYRNLSCSKLLKLLKLFHHRGSLHITNNTTPTATMSVHTRMFSECSRRMEEDREKGEEEIGTDSWIDNFLPSSPLHGGAVGCRQQIDIRDEDR
jgi:hypothetical protein